MAARFLAGPLSAAILLSGTAAPPPEVSARPNLVLITIDTLRADHVGSYGSLTARTPTLDDLARRGVLVEDAVVQAPQTRPSHASLLTGLYPYQHGVRDNAAPPLRASVPTLATLLKAAGFETAGFIGAYPVSRASGLDRGFDVFDDPFGGDDDFRTSGDGSNERPANEVVDAALAWLARPRTRPFFAWVHVFDPHHPYQPPPPFARIFPRSPYDGEVAFADQQIGRLVSALRSDGRLGSTVIAATSDHGEGLGDHGEDEHHLFVYDSTLKVPLILSGPTLAPGARVQGQFRSVDLVATLLELLGVPAAATSGVSRAAVLRSGGRIPENESYSEGLYGALHFDYAPLRALRTGLFKYVDAPEPELFDLAADPKETKNLLAVRGALAQGMRAKLLTLDPERGAVPAAGRIDAETQERLAALGYTGGVTVPRPSGEKRPDPKTRIAQFNRFQRSINEALRSRRAGDDAGVVRALSPLTTEFGGSFSVFSYLGRALVQLRRFDEAIPLLARARDLSPRAGPPYQHLAEALAGARRPAEALVAVDQGLVVSPRNADLARTRAVLLVRAGREPEAGAWLESAITRFPADGRLRAELGNLARNAGDLARADQESRRATELEPRNADVWVGRGLAMGALGREAEARQAFAKALSLDAKHRDALFYSAVSQLRGNDTKAAQLLLDRLLVIEPRYPGARDVLAAVTAAVQGVALRIIRVGDPSGAEAVKRRLAAGEPFEVVARALSTDPSAAAGGDLGAVTPSDLAEPLRSAIATLAPGAVAGPLPTTPGFLFVKRER